jgi:hypothetical protein
MWVGALRSKVTLLSTIVALLMCWGSDCILLGRGHLHIPISSVLGASIGKMANLSTIETCRGCFS